MSTKESTKRQRYVLLNKLGSKTIQRVFEPKDKKRQASLGLEQEARAAFTRLRFILGVLLNRVTQEQACFCK